ncbi:nuclear transport factor 2 family protein [Microbacterium sp. X-17]|uniref:nuclear transport factor 2 family protein n=1 Tax=Microbacterium sp. X-17 TaxID=3144404 RepID=UPI0031F481EE
MSTERSIRDLVLEHFATEDRKDVPGNLATFTDDCWYEIPALGVSVRGKEAIGRHMTDLGRFFPDLVNLDPQIAVAGREVWVRTRVRRTHGQTWMGIEPTGRVIETTTVSYFRVADDGLFECEVVYLDVPDLLFQLGLTAAPTGKAIVDRLVSRTQ